MDNVEEAREYIRQCYAEALVIGEKEGFPLKLDRRFTEELEALQETSSPEDSKVGVIQAWRDDVRPAYVCTRMIWDMALPNPEHCHFGNTTKDPEKWELQEIAEILNTSITGYSKYRGVSGKGSENTKKFFEHYGKQRAWKRSDADADDLEQFQKLEDGEEDPFTEL